MAKTISKKKTMSVHKQGEEYFNLDVYRKIFENMNFMTQRNIKYGRVIGGNEKRQVTIMEKFTSKEHEALLFEVENNDKTGRPGWIVRTEDDPWNRTQLMMYAMPLEDGTWKYWVFSIQMIQAWWASQDKDSYPDIYQKNTTGSTSTSKVISCKLADQLSLIKGIV